MAHVLVAFEEGTRQQVIRAVAEEILGHTVTVATSFWEALAVLRTSQDPLVVIYDRALLYTLQPDEVEALATQKAALRRHHYVATSSSLEPLPARVLELVASLSTETLYMPWQIEDLRAAIEGAASQLGGA